MAHKKLQGLDHLRTLAITLVFLFHYGQLFSHPKWVNTVGRFGWTGVDLFFVLSGYLIASQLFKKIKETQRLSLAEFFTKRIFRIIPVYLVVLAIYLLIPYAREWESPAPAWKYLTFTYNFGADLRGERTFSHVWSLCIEEQFYLLLPVVLAALLYFRSVSKGSVILVTLFIAGFILRYYCYTGFVEPYLETTEGWLNWYKWIYYPTYCRLDGLLAGICIAALFTFRPLIKKSTDKYGNILFFTGIAVLTGAYFLCTDMSSFAATIYGFPLIATGYGLLITGALSPRNFLYKLRWRLSSKIATLSYSLYLSHKIAIHITQEQLLGAGLNKDSNLTFGVCVISCMIAALLLRTVVEKPFLKLRGKILKGKD